MDTSHSDATVSVVDLSPTEIPVDDLQQLQMRHAEEARMLDEQFQHELELLAKSEEPTRWDGNNDAETKYIIRIDYARFHYIACLRWVQLLRRHYFQLEGAGYYCTNAKIQVSDQLRHWKENERMLRPQARALGLPVDYYLKQYQ